MRVAVLGLISLLSACSVADPGGNSSGAQTRKIHSTPSASPTPHVMLQDYVGKYPFDKIGGKTFLDQPEVQTAVKASGAGAEIYQWIFEDAGPQTPIALRTGRLISWGCEAHNCGSHNWTIFLTRNGSDAEICYHDESSEPKTRWYADGRRETRTDDCPSGDEQ